MDKNTLYDNNSCSAKSVADINALSILLKINHQMHHCMHHFHPISLRHFSASVNNATRNQQLSLLNSISTIIVLACRLHMLEAQCQNWGGITSVAIYWPLLVVGGEVTNSAGTVEAMTTLQAFHERMQSNGVYHPTCVFEPLSIPLERTKSLQVPSSKACFVWSLVFVLRKIRPLLVNNHSYASTGNCRLDLVLLSENIKPEMLWAYPYNALRNAAIARSHTEVCLPSPGSK